MGVPVRAVQPGRSARRRVGGDAGLRRVWHAHATGGLIAVGLFTELQRRIPDKWFFRRLLPAAVYVVVAVIGCGQLGQEHWADVGLARSRAGTALQAGGGAAAGSLVLLAVAAVACALAVPLAAGGVDALVSGAWPWWLMPLGSRVRTWRARRWGSPADLEKAAVRARADGHELRAARLDALRARTTPDPPRGVTWSADRFDAVRSRVPYDVSAQWPRLKLLIAENVSGYLGEARDAYDSACEAIVWSVAVTVLGAWWWPAFVAGVVMWLASWRWLRRAVAGLCDATEWVFERYGSLLGLPA
jgi:hypothetical protein